MKDERKTKKHLIEELQQVRAELAKLTAGKESPHDISPVDVLTTVKVSEQFAPLFQKAQEYVRRYFADKKESPSEGTIEIFGERYVLVRAASLSIAFFKIVQNLYRDKEKTEAVEVARNLLFDVAHAIGLADARSFHKKMNLIDPIERLSVGPVLFSHSGWAFVDIFPESSPTPDENYYLIYDHPYSFEADAWIRAGEATDVPICVMNAGYSSGWCEESFGIPLVATEIMCRAKGDDCCRFIMAPPTKIEGHIRKYMKGKTRMVAKRPSYEIPDFFSRKRVEEELRESEQKYRALVENTNDIAYSMDAQGALTYLAPQVRRYGIEPEEALGAGFWEFVFPEDRERLAGDFERTLATGEEFPSQFRLIDKKGGVHWLEEDGKALRDESGGITGISGMLRDITERKQAEEALRESEQRFRSLVETTSDWVWDVDQNGVYTYASPKVKDLLGYGPAEVIGKTPFDFMPAEEAERVEGLFRAIAESREPFAGWENTNLHKDGRRVVLDTSGVPILDADGNLLGYRGIDRDITERKRAEEALRESEKKFRNLTEEITDGVAVTVDGKNYWVNKAFSDIFGYTKKELIGKGADFVIVPEEMPKLLKNMRDRLAGRDVPFHYESIARRKDGKKINISVSAKKILFENKQAIQIVIRDITEQKQFARRLARAHEEERRRLSGQLHDDLGQLLTVAKIRVDRLRDAQFDDLVMLTRELSEVSALLDSALENTRDLSRRLRPPLLDQLGLVTALRALGAQFKSNTGIVAHVEEEGLGERFPEETELLIYRVAQEALTNVAKHAQASEVHVSLTVDDEHAQLTVTDNGKGFDVETLENRTDCLGVRSMRSRVTDSGGIFRITSELTRGTTVYVRLPLERSES